MISGSPSFFVWSLSDPRPTGIDSFLDRYADQYWFYGSGKVALRDGLATLSARRSGDRVLVPAYLPDAVVEPIAELGLEPEYYAINPSLAPDLVDLEARLDDDVLAAMSVNYFGFPQPGLEAFEALLEAFDCFHVDDNAHAALSVDPDGETLLGTRGHLGITSLWKLLPVPNGAVLYVNDDSIAERFEPSSLAQPATGFDVADCRFVLTSLLRDLLASNATVKHSVDALVAGRLDAAADPADRYEASKSRLSKLAHRVIEDADPDEVRAVRRTNYRAWLDVFSAYPDVEVLFPALPRGICPQVFPVRTAAPDALRADLERCGVGGVHRWPRLARAVLEDPAYDTARRLSREILAIPVHQHVDPATIRSIGRRLLDR